MRGSIGCTLPSISSEGVAAGAGAGRLFDSLFVSFLFVFSPAVWSSNSAIRDSSCCNADMVLLSVFVCFYLGCWQAGAFAVVFWTLLNKKATKQWQNGAERRCMNDDLFCFVVLLAVNSELGGS